MNRAQHDYLARMVRFEFAAQGYRGGIKPEVQVDAAVKLMDRAIKANAPGMFEDIARKIVLHVRTARLVNVPDAVRTVQPCDCNKPKAPHTKDLHS